MEGMRGFVARHAGALDRARTRFVVLECVGGPEAIVLEGEGMLRMRDYTPAVRDWLAACGERAGHPLRRGLRSGFATDALIALKAGYPTAVLAAIDRTRWPRTTTRQRDVAANLDFGTVAAVAAVCLEAVRSLSRRGSSRARADRVLARARSRPRSGPPRAARAARRAAGRAGCPSSRASSSPRTSGARAARGAARERRAEHARAPARGGRAIAGSALRPRVASRSATVKTVTSAAYGLGRAQVAPDARAGPAGARGRGSRAAGGAGTARRRGRRASRTRAAGAARSRASSAPSRSWPGNPMRPSGRSMRVHGLAASCSSAAMRIASPRVSSSASGSRSSAATASACSPKPAASGSRSIAATWSSTSSVWSWTSRWWNSFCSTPRSASSSGSTCAVIPCASISSSPVRTAGRADHLLELAEDALGGDALQARRLAADRRRRRRARS